MHARRPKESHRDTITFEIEMLHFCADRLAAAEKFEEKDEYVCLESFLLHYRNLIRFFSGKHHREDKGDLSTANPSPWANRQPSEQEIAVISQPAAQLDTKYHEAISKYLQHCTRTRFDRDRGWDVGLMLREVIPIIEDFDRVFPA